jgi:hypothetical protein
MVVLKTALDLQAHRAVFLLALEWTARKGKISFHSSFYRGIDVSHFRLPRVAGRAGVSHPNLMKNCKCFSVINRLPR